MLVEVQLLTVIDRQLISLSLSLSLSLSVFQVSLTTRDLVTLSSAGSHRRVERDSAVCATGPGRAGVHHLSLTAGKRFSQCRLPALLLQAGV